MADTHAPTFMRLSPFWLVSSVVQSDAQLLVFVFVVSANRSTWVTASHGICDSRIDPLQASQNATDWPVRGRTTGGGEAGGVTGEVIGGELGCDPGGTVGGET